MAIRLFSKQALVARRGRVLASAAMAMIAALTMSFSAHAFEIKARIKTVNRTGAIELTLPKGSMVAIGDKVRVSVTPDTMSKEVNKTRWTVKALNGDVIVAIPDGTPIVMPEPGFAAVINSIANQPPAEKEPETGADVVAKPEAKTPDDTKPMVAMTKAEVPETDGEPVEAKPSEEMSAAPSAIDMEKTEDPSQELAKQQETADDPMTQQADGTPKAPMSGEAEAEAPMKEASKSHASEQAEPASAASKPETAPMADKVQQSEALDGPSEKLELKGSIPDTAVEMPAPADAGADAVDATPMAPKGNPADIHDCDRLAAHSFDPDAKVEGVAYASLKAGEVIEICQQAIDTFPDEARFYSQLTRGLHKAGRIQEAFEATRKGAELGSGHSMAFLAVMFQQGQAVPKDLGKALEWFEKAAAKGNPAAMVFAAAMHRDGTGTVQNYGKAAIFYQQAADLDVAEAMTGLAVFLDRGQGVEKEPDEAARYFLKALKADDVEARKLLYEAPGAISLETRKQIQERLKSDNYYRGPIDGDFGTGTRNALTLFRRAR
ncbi:SEL1-like repeat protein [Cohaesibacter intestini]|uniref:SEL1-like repeat protein n=1 Tax=Cohaesibacter intestini TaxID=2211145 RepID=UPI000DEB89F1|nr:SEL1-like repeat protein [Cohaesibacter intestini]